jgi:quercetin dioxygenase-like cupin family protein
MTTSTRFTVATLLIALCGVTAHLAWSQQQGVKRLDLLKQELSIPGREVVQARVDFAPGAAFPRHSHPGEEIAYVIEGTLEYQFDDKPPVTLKAGDSLFIPAGAVHSARNVGQTPASELATYIIEKGRPPLRLAN